jgi:hypothetical protein
MKTNISKMILLLVANSIATFAQAQCNCGTSNSFISVGDFAIINNEVKSKNLTIETYGEWRKFKPHNHDDIEVAGTTGHMHHTSASSQVSGIFVSSFRMQYGITNLFALSAVVPHLFINAAPHNNYNFGDISLTGRYFIPITNYITAMINVGVKLPTGQKSLLVGEVGSQIGSGSYDPIAGISIQKRWDAAFLSASLNWKYGTTGYEKIKLNNNAIFNTTYAHKIFALYKKAEDDSITCHPPVFTCYGIASINTEYADVQFISNTPMDNTGGIFAGLIPGLQLQYKTWSLPLSVSIPIMQNMKGEQHKTKYRFRFGFIKSF